jgi:hypothetical protein
MMFPELSLLISAFPRHRWMNGFFREGNSEKELELTDLYKVLPSDSSEALGKIRYRNIYVDLYIQCILC